MYRRSVKKVKVPGAGLARVGLLSQIKKVRRKQPKITQQLEENYTLL